MADYDVLSKIDFDRKLVDDINNSLGWLKLSPGLKVMSNQNIHAEAEQQPKSAQSS